LKVLVNIGIFFLLSISSSLQASDQPQGFFKNYVQLGGKFDSKVTELYSDQALIHAYRVYPHGLERSMEFSGVQWKQLLTKVMPAAKAQNDKSTFSNIVVAEVEGGYKIKADRYSVRKCYTDTGYYMVIKPASNGGFKIFEEYMETKPLPNC
jgi:hypothetical protein